MSSLRPGRQSATKMDAKPRDLEERTTRFAEMVRCFVRKLPRTVGNLEDAKQLIRASGSVPANCIANNRRLLDLTAGFWQNVYKGDYGRVAFGAQYEYIKRESFDGVGGAPSTDDNIVYSSIRYYPF